MIAFIASAALSFAAPAAVQIGPAAPATCSPPPADAFSEPERIARRAVAVQLDAVVAEAAQAVRTGSEAPDAPPSFVARRRVRIAALGARQARLVVEHRISLSGQDHGWTERRGLTREIELAHGRVHEVGGIPFLVAARNGGWTIAPQADLFPTFVRSSCWGVVDVG